MSKLGQICQYFVWPPLFSSTALTLLGMELTRASQIATGVLFHSSMTTSRSWWMLETLRSSTFHLRMPHRCSILFRSGDMLGQSITFTPSFCSKAVVVSELCLGSFFCWNTALPLDFSSQSPDLNPIEHEFHQLKRRVKAETPQNKQQLELVALKAGKSISKDETKSLVMSMGHRFTAVIVRKLSATK